MKKGCSLKLNNNLDKKTSIEIWSQSLTQAISIETFKIRNSKSDFWPMLVSSGGQGQIPPSLGPFGDLLKALMFLSNLNGFNSSPSPLEQRFNSRKESSSKTKVGKEKVLKWFSHFLFLSLFLFLFMFLHYLFVLLSCFWASLVLCFVCLHVLFVCFLFCFVLFFIKIKIKIIEKLEKYKNSVYLCILVFVYPRWSLKQNFLNSVSLVI